MRIAVVANDTHGGVEPYVALAVALQRSGHDVRFVAPGNFGSFVRRRGVAFAPLSGDVESAARALAGTNLNLISSMRRVAGEMRTRIFDWTREVWAACEEVDAITGGIGGMVSALSVAEKLNVPFVETHLQPVRAPTNAFPGALFPGIPSWLGGAGRKLSHELTELALWMPFRSAMQAARSQVLQIDSEPADRRSLPAFYGFSRHLLPALPQSDRERKVTGYWTFPANTDWEPTQQLQAFLAKPGPIVSAGFGSMVERDAEATTRILINASRRAGARLVLLGGWAGLGMHEGGDDVFVAKSIPHDWLFPRVSVVVHHGGAGTTGAGLRAGVPAIVVPFGVDQPFWASRLAAIGVAPRPIPHSRLTEERLHHALETVLENKEMAARAKTFGDLVRKEPGTDDVVRFFDEGMDRRRGP